MPTTDAESEPRKAQPRLIRRITAKNLLSFGPDGISLELGPLNVLIGPNGSGKSNLIETLGLFQAAPSNLASPVRTGGGVQDWIWKGQPKSTATVETVVTYEGGQQPLRHAIDFRESAGTFELVDERVENERPDPGHADPLFYYRFQGGKPVIRVGMGRRKELRHDHVVRDESILSQRKDPDQFPELTHLSQAYGRMRLYREWVFGRATVFREPQKADLRSDPLEEDFSNLGLFLNSLRQKPKAKTALLRNLRDLYEGLTDFDVRIREGTVQVVFFEGELAIPAPRLSDGTLRYLCLLAILCDPEPPSLVCIEEPELGLHPDLIPRVADLLVDASQRCQLVVTTHSDILVDALSEQAGSVVVCEKHEGRTSMERLDPSHLAPWLEKYRLGQLWTRGDLGGTRW